MSAGSFLVSGSTPDPELAAEAVRGALANAGLSRADHILLFLTRDFARHAPPALRAAARVGGTIAITGCTAYGLLSERGWHLEQPGAVALVLDTPDGNEIASAPLLSFTGNRILPYDWQGGEPRFGLLDAEAITWSHGRVVDQASAECRLPASTFHPAVSPGLSRLGAPLSVEATTGYELRRLGGMRAIDSLRLCLPAAWRDAPPLHRLALLREHGQPALSMLAVTADGALTLGEPLLPGETVQWAIRQPDAAAADMQSALSVAVDGKKTPDFALMFSCLGRGPLFYGGEDRDLALFRERFPGVPLIGAYGSGQIAPTANGNRLFQNTVLTLLYESAHV